MLVSSIGSVSPTTGRGVKSAFGDTKHERKMWPEEKKMGFAERVSLLYPSDMNHSSRILLEQQNEEYILSLVKSDPPLFWRYAHEINKLGRRIGSLNMTFGLLTLSAWYKKVRKIVILESCKTFSQYPRPLGAHSRLSLEKRQLLTNDYVYVLTLNEKYPYNERGSNYPIEDMKRLKEIVDYLYEHSIAWSEKMKYKVLTKECWDNFYGYGLGLNDQDRTWLHSLRLESLKTEFDRAWELYNDRQSRPEWPGMSNQLSYLREKAPRIAHELEELLPCVLIHTIDDLSALGGDGVSRSASSQSLPHLKVDEAASVVLPKPPLAPPTDAKGDLISFTQGVVPPKPTLFPPRTSDGKEIIFAPSWVATTYIEGGRTVTSLPPPCYAEAGKPVQEQSPSTLLPLRSEPIPSPSKG